MDWIGTSFSPVDWKKQSWIIIKLETQIEVL